jgi:hypothetical protein
MDEKTKKLKEWERQVFREIPSQIPTHCIKASYEKQLKHCITADSGGLLPKWACKVNGAPIKARMVYMRILERDGTEIDYAPVATLYCSSCDTVPVTRKGDSVFRDQLQTLSM